LQIDSLLARFGASVFLRFDLGVNNRVFSVHFTAPCNMRAVGKKIKNLLQDVGYTEIASYVGESNTDITRLSGGHTYRFEVQWGDCPAGCTEGHSWSFAVNNNCQVSYLGEQHYSPIAIPFATQNCGITTATTAQSETAFFGKITPNPVNSTAIISVDAQNLPLIANLYTIEGRLVQEISLNQAKTALNVDNLPNGVYFLNILYKGSQKIVVLH
jgi:hypothetical protein